MMVVGSKENVSNKQAVYKAKASKSVTKNLTTEWLINPKLGVQMKVDPIDKDKEVIVNRKII